MRGRKPQPTALKVLRGNPGKRALPANEPRPEIAAPDPPTWLDGEALVEWNRVVPELLTLGLLSRLDRANLVAYCRAWGELCMATTMKAETADELVKVAAVERKAREQLTKFGALFGFSPMDRTRIHASPVPEEKQSPLEQLRAPVR